MIDLHIPPLIEALVAGTVAAFVAALIAYRIDGDVLLLPAVTFLTVFLAVLLRRRSSTINHRSSRRARARARRGED